MLSCKKSQDEGVLILTKVPAGSYDPASREIESWRYAPGAQIVMVDPVRPASARILTGDFHSACYPEISYDGKNMVFSAKESENDPWQIYEMEIKNGRYRKVTSFKTDCLDPVYLPAGRMAFSRYTENDTVRSAYSIYTGNLDGTNIRQVTFGPYEELATTVLKDGRFLCVHRNKLSENLFPVLEVMRPDGTKADMFYKGGKDTRIISRARQTGDGKLWFVETSGESSGEYDLISISYNRPLHSRINLTKETSGNFNSVLPLLSGKTVVSYCPEGSDHYALYEFDAASGSLGRLIFEDTEYSITEAAEATKYQRPKKLPSEVDMAVKTGLLLCQDANFTGYKPGGMNTNNRMAAMVEILGIDTTYGAVPVEIDGSVYLKIIADTPFRIRTLDKNGNVIAGPCSYIWLRPNERRGCVGCHEDPETVPQNRIPGAVRKDPFIIPVHVTEIKEKTVELE